MSIVKPQIIVILGPTSSGKSDVAIKLAQHFNGEIISADSRQVYKGLDIGSGKVIRDPFLNNPQFVIDNQSEYISKGIIHHLINVAEPMEDFNISHFKTLVEIIIKNIIAKGKIPIICGGTGFWIDSVILDFQIPKVAPNEILRNILSNKTNEELFEILKEKDPKRASEIDSKNKLRLIRALEIIEKLGKVPPKTFGIENETSKYKFLQIGIKVPREILNVKIKKRLDERFAQGMIKEVENLTKNKVSFEWLERIGLEYRWISRYLEGKIDLEEMKQRLYFDIIHYAKRQMTWFRRNKKIIWLKNYAEIKKEVEKKLK